MRTLQKRADDLAAVRLVNLDRQEWWERGAPPRFQSASILDSRIPPEVGEWCAATEKAMFDAQPPPGNLLFTGLPRTGKTTMAYAALRWLNDHHIAFQSHTGSSLAEVMKDWDNPDHGANVQALAWCSILFVDDLGAERLTEWWTEQFMLIADRRYCNLQPMVLTSNLSLDQLDEHYGPRLMRRLLGDDPTIVFTVVS